MPNDQHPVNDSRHIDPDLKEFIERVIIPMLVKEYLAQSQKPEAQKVLMTEQRNCSSKPSGTQTEAKSKELRSKDLLTVAEAAVVLGIKEATVRAWILKRKVCKAGQSRSHPNERTRNANRAGNCSIALADASRSASGDLQAVNS